MEIKTTRRSWCMQFFWLLISSLVIHAATEMTCSRMDIPDTKYIAVHCVLPFISANISFENVPVAKTRILTLKCLNLNEESYMESDAFNFFGHIERLIIKNCKFESFPEEAFHGLKSLQELRITKWKEQESKGVLPSTFSQDLVNVTTLEMNGIGFGTVPRTFWLTLPKVQNIIFEKNGFTNLKWLESFSTSGTNLLTLDMGKNSLTILSADRFQCFPWLESLLLHNNFIYYIDEKAFNGLQSLQILYLSTNNLSILPTLVFSDLTNLKKLMLQSNKLTFLPKGILNGLTYLTYLSLGSNLLYFSDSNADVFYNLKHLTKLILTRNNISYLPTSIFRDLNQLDRLALKYNNLSGVNSNSFVPLQKLQTLIIEGCNLSSLDFLVHLPSLKKIYAHVNKVLSPQYHDVKNSVDLEIVDFSVTGMSSMGSDEGNRKEGMFTNFSRLKSLRVDVNSIGDFDYFMVPDSLIDLDLSGNPLSTLRDELGVRNNKNISTLAVSQNTFQEWNNESFSKYIKAIFCDYCMIKIIKTNTFSGLKRLKLISFVKSTVYAVERFAFRHSYIGAQMTAPDVQGFSTKTCGFATKWIIADISFVPIRTSNGKHVCQMLTQCKSNVAVSNSALGLKQSPIVKNMILDCGNNNMTSFIANFSENENVTHLYLDGNRLHVLLNGTFQKMLGLQFLYLNNSHISAMEAEVFFKLTDLTELYLHNNKLQLVHVRQFVRQMHLSKLWLQNNQILALDGKVFVGQSGLQELRLDNNLLIHLRGYEFSKTSTLTHLYLNGNNMTYIPTKTFLTLRHLRELHLESNSLTCIPKSVFYGSRNIEILYLNDNLFSNIEKNMFDVPLKLRKLHFERNYISDVHPLAFQNLKDLKALYLQDNQLKHLYLHQNALLDVQKTEFFGLNNLENLWLHNNRISYINVVALSSLKHLKNLTVHNNQIQQLAVWELPPSLRNITLSGNNLSCNCDFLNRFENWVIGSGRNKISDIGTVICKHENGTNAKLPIMQYTHEYCQKKVSLLIPLLGTGGAFVVVIIVAILGYLNRLEMQVWLYSQYGLRLFYPRNDAEAGKEFHGFVAFSPEDEEFVGYHLVPGLEPAFKLCVYTRDFPLGVPIITSICASVENSCRTLLVLSNNFLSNKWCKFEFKMAHFQMMQDRCCRLIVIILEDIDLNVVDKELKVYLKTSHCIRWGERFFWEKLRFAMPDVAKLDQMGERQPLLTN